MFRKMLLLGTALFSLLLLTAGLLGNSACGGGAESALGLGISSDLDADDDGVDKDSDCNDLDADVFPGADDFPDGSNTDNNCDGIDGDLANSIWVSDSEGNDSNSGGIADPVKSISQGISLAAANPAAPAVYVVEGSYTVDVQLADDVSLYGGFSLLQVDSLREHDAAIHETKLLGDGTSSYTITLETGSAQTVNAALILRDADAVVSGFHVQCGPDGVAIILEDSSASIEENEITCPVPAAPRILTIGIAALLSPFATEDVTVAIRRNTIATNGTANINGFDFGIIAVPLQNAERALSLIAEENDITLQGTSERVAGIYVADEDSDPLDDASSDLNASFSIEARKNTLHLQGDSGAFMGIFAGAQSGIAPISSEPLWYLQSAEIAQNVVRIAPSSDPSIHIGILVSFSRDGARVENNVVTAETVGTMQGYGILSAVSSAHVLHNTYHASGGRLLAAGIVSMVRSDGGAWNYTNSQMGNVINNIVSFSTATAMPCEVYGFAEMIPDSNPASIGRVSPLGFRNNDMFFDTTCTEALYRDDQAAIDLLVTDLATLHAKTGFHATDPTAMSANFSADPLFVGAASEDFTLQASSPCIDAGIELADVVEDLLGNSRPQGTTSDVGAYEFF